MNLDNDNDKWPFSSFPRISFPNDWPFLFCCYWIRVDGRHEPRDRETNFRAANRTHTRKKERGIKRNKGITLERRTFFLFFGRRRRLFRYLSTTLADVVDYESIKGLFSRSFALDSSNLNQNTDDDRRLSSFLGFEIQSRRLEETREREERQ